MAALGVVAVSAMVLMDGGLFGDVPDRPTGAPSAVELPLIELHLSRNDVAHFEQIYTHLDGPQPNLQRYQDENAWRRAQLGYDGRLYAIQVKSHGRVPGGHSEWSDNGWYRFISLSIKLEAGERIHGLNRFKLIVPSGLESHASPVMSMATHIGAFVQDHHLVRVRINNRPGHRYYFSNSLDQWYLESIGFAPFRRIRYDFPERSWNEHGGDTSLIYAGGEWEFDAREYRHPFELGLAQMEVPEREWESLFQRYAAFNAAISGNALTNTDPAEFLDPAYLQRFEIARYVLGLKGSGFVYGNLRVLFNTANGKFYPAFNRDNEMMELDLRGGRTPELQINKLQDGGYANALPLFHYVATSDRLRQRVYRGLYEFIDTIETEDRGSVDGRRAQPGSDCRDRPFVGGLPFVGEVPPDVTPCGARRVPPPDILDDATIAANIESLRTYLEASAPEFSAGVSHDRSTLVIRPNSMSALRVETLTIGANYAQGYVRVDVNEVQGARETRVVESHVAAVRADGTVDLGGALVDARLSTGLDLAFAPLPLPDVHVRWITGLEEVQRRGLERRFGLQDGREHSPRTWRYELADASPARIAEIVGHDAVEDTHGIIRAEATIASPYRPRRLTRAPRLYELVFSFSRPLPGLQSETIALSFVNTVTGQEVEARRVPNLDAPAEGALSPASAFADATDSFEDWASSHAALTPRRTGPREITLARGAYDLQENLVFPAGYDVVIEGGTDLRLGPGVVMQVLGGLSVAGSAGNPVTVRPLDPVQPFGVVAVLGDGSQRTSVRYLDLSGGSDAWVGGARFSGALSIHYQREVEVSHASIGGNHGDAGLSIKYARGRLSDSVFMGNRVAQVDLHYFDGVVRSNRLAGTVASGRTGSGLHATGSRLVATGNEFSGFMDSGVGVGESSEALLAANTLSDNALALAVTDLSTAYVHADNVFGANELDVSASMQKRHFGGGTVVFAGNTRPAGMSVETDRVSSVVHVAAAAIERLRPSEIPPAGVVASLSELSVAPGR